MIPFEEVSEQNESVGIPAPVPMGSCVRPAGQDMKRGETVLRAGTEIGPRHVALLASLGYGLPRVTRRPLVAVLATGDELVEPGMPLAPGQIYNSNSPMLAAAVVEAGAVPRNIPSAHDEPRDLTRAVEQARGCDLLITSGGASVGDFDHVKQVIGGAGSLAFWRVRVRPGKPLLFGKVGEMPVIGLPGNPTSAMVTFEEFVRPAVRKMLGAPGHRLEVEAELAERLDNRGGRRTYARVRLEYRDGRFLAYQSGPQDSAMILPLARAHGLLEIPETRDEMLPGERAPVQVWHLPEEGT